MPDDPPYKVGPGHPPLHTRFQKGRSGNPKGRPKGGKNLATLLGKALDQRVPVTENGKRRGITKRELIVTHLVNKSVGADLRAIALLLGMVQRIEAGAIALAAAALAAPAPAALAAPAPADQAVMLALVERLRAAKADPNAGLP